MAQGPDEISSIRHASTREEIRAGLAELGAREEVVTARLNELLATQRDLSRQLARLDIARAQLGSQVVAVRNISNGMLSAASSTAQRISGAVKKLDREQASVKATLEVVEQVAELKSCVLGVTGSMGMPQDWETAANFLRRASNIPDAVIDGAFAEQIVPTAEVPDTPRETLDSAAESLCALFLREFEAAAQAGDGAGVTRFFKLFPLIGRAGVGLDAYGRYVCSGIAARARSNMSAATRSDGSYYANALTRLFEHIAQIVDGHQSLVERHYGAGSMVKVIERVQVEADLQGGLILDTWADERKLNRRITEAKSYPFNFLVQSFLNPQKSSSLPSRTASPAPGSGRTSEDDGVDMKDVDALLSESATMLARWSLYTRFLASKVAPASEDERQKLHLPAFIVHSTLQKKVTDILVNPFNALASFFFRRSVEKSFQLDEAPTDLSLSPTKPLGSNPPYITTSVDDIMYIVSQVLQRTLATSQRPVVGSVVPSVGQVLGNDFFGMVQRKMRDESYPKATIQGALPPEHLIVGFLVLLNNLDVATDYVRRIVRETGGKPIAKAEHSSDGQIVNLGDSFPFGNEAAFVEKTLTSMETSFELKIGELITEAMNVMLKQVMGPRLRPVLAEAFRDVDYAAVDEQDGDEPESSDFVAQRFERGWQNFTLPIKRIATERNYDKLLTITVAHLARVLEKRIRSYYGRVSELGAVRLERDITGIIAAAVRGGRYELRTLFARCMQMTVVMNMEDDEWDEVSKLSGAQLDRETGVEWKLDADDRKFARSIVNDRT